MSRAEAILKLEEISRAYRMLMQDEEWWDYPEEQEAILEQWNAFVPIAERSGVTHLEMSRIFKGEQR